MQLIAPHDDAVTALWSQLPVPNVVALRHAQCDSHACLQVLVLHPNHMSVRHYRLSYPHPHTHSKRRAHVYLCATAATGVVDADVVGVTPTAVVGLRRAIDPTRWPRALA